ncbi:MAG: transcriptional repressor [Sphaerochaetaceae bacterium]|nr:transcriptional repressor [Sphaerochaetaceae bacterium]
MSGTSQYRTKQRDKLLSYLRSMHGSHVTVNDISDHFQGQGVAIGVTTIYRQLERMVEEGLVNRYFLDKTSGACFEYIDKQENCQKPICFHCKCEACGKLIHLKCGELEQIQAHLLMQHGFELDPAKTVFYGVCEQCGTAHPVAAKTKIEGKEIIG